MSTRLIDIDKLHEAEALRERATSLRDQSNQLSPVLAATYRRRASELELEAFVAEIQSGVPYEEVHVPAA